MLSADFLASPSPSLAEAGIVARPTCLCVCVADDRLCNAHTLLADNLISTHPLRSPGPKFHQNIFPASIFFCAFVDNLDEEEDTRK